MKNPTVVLKSSKFDVRRSYVMLCCRNYSRKLLPSAIGIDSSLHTGTMKIQERNYVVVTSF